MIQVIETNLSIDKDNIIRDHQSRIVEVEDWDTYCKAFEEYNPWLMQKRNEYMVDLADRVIAVWNCSKGGTANCVKYAEKVGKEIIKIEP